MILIHSIRVSVVLMNYSTYGIFVLTRIGRSAAMAVQINQRERSADSARGIWKYYLENMLSVKLNKNTKLHIPNRFKCRLFVNFKKNVAVQYNSLLS
jgi:hypothetical protein